VELTSRPAGSSRRAQAEDLAGKIHDKREGNFEV